MAVETVVVELRKMIVEDCLEYWVLEGLVVATQMDRKFQYFEDWVDMLRNVQDNKRTQRIGEEVAMAEELEP